MLKLKFFFMLRSDLHMVNDMIQNSLDGSSWTLAERRDLHF